MLRRFADARLRSALARETDKRERAEDKARRIDGLLRQKTADSATNYALAQRWKSIATGALTDFYAERARTQRWKSIASDLAADLAAERARTQETR